VLSVQLEGAAANVCNSVWGWHGRSVEAAAAARPGPHPPTGSPGGPDQSGPGWVPHAGARAPSESYAFTSI